MKNALVVLFLFWAQINLLTANWSIEFLNFSEKKKRQIKWEKIKDAHWYHLLIFEDKERTNLIWVKSTRKNQVQLPTFFSDIPVFYLELRATDKKRKQIAFQRVSSLFSLPQAEGWIREASVVVKKRLPSQKKEKAKKFFSRPVLTQSFSYQENKYAQTFFQTANLGNHFHWYTERMNFSISSNLSYETNFLGENNYRWGLSFSSGLKKIPLHLSYHFHRDFSAASRTHQNINFSYHLPRPRVSLNLGYTFNPYHQVFSWQSSYFLNRKNSFNFFYQHWENFNSFSFHYYRRY
jgi:hypothetical protein